MYNKVLEDLKIFLDQLVQSTNDNNLAINNFSKDLSNSIYYLSNVLLFGFISFILLVLIYLFIKYKNHSNIKKIETITSKNKLNSPEEYK